jgi:chaperone modulatory protein CbpM
MISVDELVIRARVEHATIEAWVQAGWLIPEREPQLAFSEVDLARATLIRELQVDFGVNDEGVTLILHLLDQVHGLRRSLRQLLETRSREGHGADSAS